MYRASLTLWNPALAASLAVAWGEDSTVTMDALSVYVEPFSTRMLRTCTEYGTDGQTIDLGWYCYTREEAEALVEAACEIAEDEGWRVSNAVYYPVETERPNE